MPNLSVRAAILIKNIHVLRLGINSDWWRMV